MPEALVFVSHHLAHLGELGERCAFPGGAVAVDEVEAARREDEEAAVDETAVATRFFDEAGDLIAIALERAVATGGLNGGDGGPALVLVVEADRALMSMSLTPSP